MDSPSRGELLAGLRPLLSAHRVVIGEHLPYMWSSCTLQEKNHSVVETSQPLSPSLSKQLADNYPHYSG